MTADPVIRYRNTHKAFKRPVLSGVNLDIYEGEMFALFGPSGTGKSVLLKTTIGLGHARPWRCRGQGAFRLPWGQGRS